MNGIVYAVGFDDQFPCNRNRYNFGIGATLFACEGDAIAFKGKTLYSVSSFKVKSVSEAIAAQDKVQQRHAESLGMVYKKPSRS